MNDLALPFYPILPEDQGKPTYEVLVSAGIEAVERQDVERWVLGYLGSLVTRHYGESSFGGWCADVGVNPETAYNYVKVYRFFGQPYSDLKMLKWTHYFSALMVSGRFSDVKREDVVAALRTANDRGMSTDVFPRLFHAGLEKMGYSLTEKYTKRTGKVLPEPVDPAVTDAIAAVDEADLTDADPRATRPVWRSVGRITNIVRRDNGRYLVSFEINDPLSVDLASESQVVIAVATIGTIIDDTGD